jgi:hypothetical protein
MNRIILAGASLCLLAGVATGASADPFAAAYGNTVTQTMPDGKKTITYVNKDGTWEQHMAGGAVMKGTFAWKDDHTACFTETDPAPKDASKATNCDDIKGEHKLGETWTEQAPNGGPTITMAITAGR